VVAKAQPITTLPNLLIKFIIRTNLLLQTMPNNNFYTEGQSQKITQMPSAKTLSPCPKDSYGEQLVSFCLELRQIILKYL